MTYRLRIKIKWKNYVRLSGVFSNSVRKETIVSHSYQRDGTGRYLAASVSSSFSWSLRSSSPLAWDNSSCSLSTLVSSAWEGGRKEFNEFRWIKDMSYSEPSLLMDRPPKLPQTPPVRPAAPPSPSQSSSLLSGARGRFYLRLKAGPSDRLSPLPRRKHFYWEHFICSTHWL